jgi:hypothetical protein
MKLKINSQIIATLAAALCLQAQPAAAQDKTQAQGALLVRLPDAPPKADKASNAKYVAIRLVSKNPDFDDGAPPKQAPIVFTAALGWHAQFNNLYPGAYTVQTLSWQGSPLVFDYAPFEEGTVTFVNCGVAGAPPPSNWLKSLFAKNPCEHRSLERYAKVENGKTTVATGSKEPQYPKQPL